MVSPSEAKQQQVYIPHGIQVSLATELNVSGQTSSYRPLGLKFDTGPTPGAATASDASPVAEAFPVVPF